MGLGPGGSSISQRASSGTDWRVHGVFDLGRGGFSHLELTDKHGAEALDRGAPVPGEVRIGDRNYGGAKGPQRFRDQSNGQADFIIRLRWNALRLCKPDGKPFDLIKHLATLPRDALPHEVSVQAVVARFRPTLPLRLIILRKPAEAAEAACKTLRRAASRKQKTLDPRSLIAAEFIILATSLPVEGYPAEEVLAAYRLTLANRAGLQAPQVAAAHRSAANPNAPGVTKLALLASHPCPVVRRS
jgi:hypothetical protein